MYGFVPASADCQITTVGNDVFKTAVAYFAQDFRCPVRGMVIDHNNVEIEIGTLAECALDGIEDRSFAIFHGYNDAGLDGKFLAGKGNFREARLEPRTDTFQVPGGNLLHFDLIIAIPGIDIIELLQFGHTGFGAAGVVQRLRNSHDRTLFRNPQAQIVQASPSPTTIDSSLFCCLNGYSDDWPKIEIVPNAAALVADTSMIYRVRIDPTCSTVAFDVSHPVEHARPRLDTCARVPDEDNIGLGVMDKVLNSCG